MLKLYLVRHAQPQVDPGQPFGSWPLTAGGRVAARMLEDALPVASRVIASPELKALETAHQFADVWPVEAETDDRLREVGGRAWADSHEAYRQQVRSYFAGDEPEGWERAGAATARIVAAADEIVRGAEDAVLVSHGLVLTLLRSWFDEVDPAMLAPVWEAMRFPDFCILDPDARQVVREFGSDEST